LLCIKGLGSDGLSAAICWIIRQGPLCVWVTVAAGVIRDHFEVLDKWDVLGNAGLSAAAKIVDCSALPVCAFFYLCGTSYGYVNFERDDPVNIIFSCIRSPDFFAQYVAIQIKCDSSWVKIKVEIFTTGCWSY
jgi:hypothetical protein